MGEFSVCVTVCCVCAECVVLAAEKETQPEAAGDVIKLRLQSKDKESTQEFSLHKVSTCTCLSSPLNLAQTLAHLYGSVFL